MQKIKSTTKIRSQEIMKNFEEYGKTRMNTTFLSEHIALLWGGYGSSKDFKEELSDFTSENVSESLSLVDSMQRMFIKNVNKDIYDQTSYNFNEVMVSCTINYGDDCKQESRFTENHDVLSCFTFNHNGNESFVSSNSRFQLTLFKNASYGHARVDKDVTDSFRAVVHEPGTSPRIFQDGIYFETGKLTTIKVERARFTRENYTKSPCNESYSYFKEDCMLDCLTQKCLGEKCKLFLYFNDSGADTNITGLDEDLCYMSALYMNGVYPEKLRLFQVQRLNDTGCPKKLSFDIFSIIQITWNGDFFCNRKNRQRIIFEQILKTFSQYHNCQS